MEKLSFYFADDKTHILDEQKVKPLQLKEYNISFNNKAVFCDVTEFAFTNYTNEMMLGHLTRLGPKVIMGLNELNFADLKKASETLYLNTYFKNTFNIDVYGNVLLTSYELINPSVRSLVVQSEKLSKTTNSLQLNNNHWEGLKRIYWKNNSKGQKRIDEENHFMELKIQGHDMCYGYLFLPPNVSADEALRLINKYVETMAAKASTHERFVLYCSTKLSTIPNFDMSQLSKKADYFYVKHQGNELQYSEEKDFQMDRGFDKALQNWLDG
jgi:hypothetical protein